MLNALPRPKQKLYLENQPVAEVGSEWNRAEEVYLWSLEVYAQAEIRSSDIIISSYSADGKPYPLKLPPLTDEEVTLLKQSFSDFMELKNIPTERLGDTTCIDSRGIKIYLPYVDNLLWEPGMEGSRYIYKRVNYKVDLTSYSNIDVCNLANLPSYFEVSGF